MKMFVQALWIVWVCLFLPRLSIAEPISYSATSTNIYGQIITGTVVLSDICWVKQGSARFNVSGFKFFNNENVFSGNGGYFEAPIHPGNGDVLSTFGFVTFNSLNSSWVFDNGFAFSVDGNYLWEMSLEQYLLLPSVIKLTHTSAEMPLLRGPWESMVLERTTGVVTPVPEPNTALLFGVSLLCCIGFFARRKRGV